MFERVHNDTRHPTPRERRRQSKRWLRLSEHRTGFDKWSPAGLTSVQTLLSPIQQYARSVGKKYSQSAHSLKNSRNSGQYSSILQIVHVIDSPERRQSPRAASPHAGCSLFEGPTNLIKVDTIRQWRCIRL